MDGIYSNLNKLIREEKANDHVVIDRQDYVAQLDYSEMDREELETRCKNSDVSVMLYQNGYRSIVKGKGVFVDVEKLKNPEVVAKLVRNAQQSTNEKRRVELALKAALQNLKRQDDYAPQIAFNEEMILFEEMTREELIDLLKGLTG